MGERTEDGELNSPEEIAIKRLDNLETMMYSFYGNERAICELRMIGYVGLHS